MVFPTRIPAPCDRCPPTTDEPRAGAQPEPASPEPSDHRLSALESLPQEMRQQIFGHLPDARDLAAVSAASLTLHESVAEQLAIAAISAALPERCASPAATREALLAIRALRPARHAVTPLRVAALVIARLPRQQREALQPLLRSTAEALGLPAAASLQFVQALETLGDARSSAVHGEAAFALLLDAAPGLPAHAQTLLYETLSRAIRLGALRYQGFVGFHNPAALATVGRLFDAIASWPDERALRVLQPLLEGFGSLHFSNQGAVFGLAWPAIRRLGRENRRDAMACLRRVVPDIEHWPLIQRTRLNGAGRPTTDV